MSPAKDLRRAVLCVLLLGLIPTQSAVSAQLRPAPPTDDLAWSARLILPVSVLSAPIRGRLIERQSDFADWNGGPVTLLVLDSRIGRDGRLWLRVLLPVRPNGSSGWIPSASAVLTQTRWRIEISTERRAVDVYRDGALVRAFRAVVGARRTPTPHGLFAIYEHVPLSNPAGFYGPWALHLTALSGVLTSFDGGPGRVAIHGRGGASLRDPLGTARSHGCVRVENSAIRFLAARVPDGSPVVVK